VISPTICYTIVDKSGAAAPLLLFALCSGRYSLFDCVDKFVPCFQWIAASPTGLSFAVRGRTLALSVRRLTSGATPSGLQRGEPISLQEGSRGMDRSSMPLRALDRKRARLRFLWLVDYLGTREG
jgi:hypothetical protein